MDRFTIAVYDGENAKECYVLTGRENVAVYLDPNDDSCITIVSMATNEDYDINFESDEAAQIALNKIVKALSFTGQSTVSVQVGSTVSEETQSHV